MEQIKVIDKFLSIGGIPVKLLAVFYPRSMEKYRNVLAGKTGLTGGGPNAKPKHSNSGLNFSRGDSSRPRIPT